jgi:hypothetical protein
MIGTVLPDGFPKSKGVPIPEGWHGDAPYADISVGVGQGTVLDVEILWGKESKMQIQKNDVVQFTEAHKWCGCLGIVKEVKKNRIMVGVPVPQQGTAYIFDDGSNIEYIGKAVMVGDDDA